MFEGFDVPLLLVKVVLATAMGGLLGLERERRSERKFAGLRTLALLCAAGPITVYVADIAEHDAVLPLLLGMYLVLTLAVAFAVAYVRFSLHRGDIGFTTSVTVFLVAMIGILVGFERFFEATSITILATVLLAERERLHRYVDRLTDEELRDSLALGALAFILYPILPTEPVDPFGVLVLREVLLFAIFVLLIEFSSYVLMQQLGGSTGLAVTGLLAGGANSFAAAGVLARIANQSRDALDAASFALLLTVTSMVLRNVGIAVVLAVPLFWLVWQPAIIIAGLLGLFAGMFWYHGEMHQQFSIDVNSPFSFSSAGKFGVAYVTILLISVGAERVLGETGLYATAVVGGLVSSAAVSVTAAAVFNDGTASASAAVGMVILGIVASLTSKIALVSLTNRELSKRVLTPLVLVTFVGVSLFVLI